MVEISNLMARLNQQKTSQINLYSTDFVKIPTQRMLCTNLRSFVKAVKRMGK